MSQASVVPVLVMVVALAGLGVLAAFRGGARSGHRLARQSQEVTRMGGNLIRALGTSAVIVAVQWAVVFFTSDPRAWGVVLGVPALFAGAAIARMFSVTEIIHTPTQDRGRR
ncbi:MAG TPA: hypothetical protein VN327_10120 [Pseudonocardiaceae bacterium]|nr:hypothetical protein [Pseudonocardiaceae bacterium]